jgi:hypothetical protein
MTNREEFNNLLDWISNRAQEIKHQNQTSLDRDNVEFGLEKMEGYIADIRGITYEETG